MSGVRLSTTGDEAGGGHAERSGKTITSGRLTKSAAVSSLEEAAEPITKWAHAHARVSQ